VPKSRFLQIRFAATAAALLLVWLLLRYLWFPGGYFKLYGIGELLLMLVVANLVVGPGLSTLLYRPGKWGLKFDVVAMLCVELAIIGWALYEFDARRPAFAVFAVDRFEAVAMAEIDAAEFAASPIVRRNAYGPTLVYAALPTDAEVMNRLIDETVFLGMADIDRRPEFWQSYPSGIGVMLGAAQPLSRMLSADEALANPVRRWLSRHGENPSRFVFLPLRARDADGTIIIDADIGYPVDVLAVDAWSALTGSTQ